jgi:dTDP-4-dehydrorhamnose 3,5-epimerase
VQTRPTTLPGVVLIEPRVFSDPRGVFFESWHAERYEAIGVPGTFVQDNVSRSVRGTLRGLHFQHPAGQGKLVTVLAGEVMDVAVDIRRNSPTYGQAFTAMLSDANRLQMYIPPGFAHGFVVTSEEAIFHYKCTEFYRPDHERSILWNDPALGIPWPVAEPLLSRKDAEALPLAALPPEALPV